MGKPSGSTDECGVAGNSQAYASQHQVLLDGSLLPVAFRSQSYQLARDICQYMVRREDADQPPNKLCTIMRSLVDDQLKERVDMMKELVETLDLHEREQLGLINDIATGLFDDEVVSWSRVVTLHAFCGYLARHCEEQAGAVFIDSADDIARLLAGIVVNRLGLWIVANGGWRAFEKQFPGLCMFEMSGVWKGMILLGLLAGALFVFYSSVRFMSGSSLF